MAWDDCIKVMSISVATLDLAAKPIVLFTNEKHCFPITHSSLEIKARSVNRCTLQWLNRCTQCVYVAKRSGSATSWIDGIERES